MLSHTQTHTMYMYIMDVYTIYVLYMECGLYTCIYTHVHVHMHIVWTCMYSPALQSTNCHGCEVGGDGDSLPEAVHTQSRVSGVWLTAQPLCPHQGHQITRHCHLHVHTMSYVYTCTYTCTRIHSRTVVEHSVWL